MSWTNASTCAAAVLLRNKLCRLKSVCNLSVSYLSLLLGWCFSDNVEENVLPFLGIGSLCIDHPGGDQFDEGGSLDCCVLFVDGKVWMSLMNEVHSYRSRCIEKFVYSGLLLDCLCIYHSCNTGFLDSDIHVRETERKGWLFPMYF